MKKSFLIEIGFVFLSGIVGLMTFFLYSNYGAMDESTTWAEVLVGSNGPSKEIGKFHAYYIDFKNWDTYRKEAGEWKLKGKLYEIYMYAPSYKSYSSSKEIYSLYKVAVDKRLGYTYKGSGPDWLADLCKHRLFNHQVYSIKFLNYDDSLLWETTSFLREEIVYGGETPKREGYVFDGWDCSFNNVVSDMTIKANFRPAQ